MPDSIAQNLAQMVSHGTLAADPAQADLAARLDRLIAALGAKKPGLFRRAATVRGLYLWGDAGRGKTLMMDMFFRRAPEPRKRRVHFHAFMAEMHERLRDFRAERDRQPIEGLAAAVAKEARLLCLDELQVKDIADATILNRLFTALIEAGTIVVVTSNSPPERLYYKGLNRDLFLPFIDLVKTNLDVVKLEVPTDYRLRKLAAAPLWYAPPDPAAMDAAFADLAGAARGEPEVLRVQGRDLKVPNALNGVARFSFTELCDRPLGPADYVAIARTYHTLLVDNIPRLDTAAQDAVRRFVILIDELYEHRVKLVASADCAPGILLTEGRQAWDFRRTSSRLTEMGSKHWLTLPHGQEVDLNAEG
jgi:cell division protein ZapE